MIVAVMMLALTSDPPRLAAIQLLSPSAAGDLALAGSRHGPIETVVPSQPRGLGWPGRIELDMVERPVVRPGGCTRQRWTVLFSHDLHVDRNMATLSVVHAATEVALRRLATCPAGGYVLLNGGIEAEQAVGALKHLDRLRRSGNHAVFTCFDPTPSHMCGIIHCLDDKSPDICGDPLSVRRELRKAAPWAVMREGATVIFWLGVSGQKVIKLRYDPTVPDRIDIKRGVIAPS